MKYEEMTPEQKRAYGFVKITKQEIYFFTQMKCTAKKQRLSQSQKPCLRVIVKEGRSKR